MPYTLRYSDTSKPATITVPDMSPGINAIDTSLSLVGKGYPNYGQAIAQNFVKLLENFASPISPENPIEGQLWYDTSDPYNKVLRIMDGTADSTRWPSANGIYQQSTDPKDSASAGLKAGDIWVDTGSNQLKIYNSNNWTTVGPSVGTGVSRTGVEVENNVLDTSGVTHSIIKSYVNGEVVAIFSSDEQFTPRIVIEGFSAIKPGINLSSGSATKTYGFIGVADSALSLKIDAQSFSGDKFLRKNDDNINGQLITGRVVFQQPTTVRSSAAGVYGLVINSVSDTNYVQVFKDGNDATLYYAKNDGRIIFRTKSSTGIPKEVIVQNGCVLINTTTNADPTVFINVDGSARILNTLTVISSATNAVTVAGSISAGKNIDVGINLTISGTTTATNTLTVGSSVGAGPIIMPGRHNTYDIGSSTVYFRSLYVSTIGSASTGTTLYGSVVGPASRLSQSTTFRLIGQMTATSFAFSGTSIDAVFTTTLTRSAIFDQPSTGTTTATQTLLVLDTSTSATVLQKISKTDFLSDVFPPGMITAYGGAVAPTGWLLCDGTSTSTIIRPNLYAAVGYTYGGSGATFYLPDMRKSTTVTNSLNFINYIIKT